VRPSSRTRGDGGRGATDAEVKKHIGLELRRGDVMSKVSRLATVLGGKVIDGQNPEGREEKTWQDHKRRI